MWKQILIVLVSVMAGFIADAWFLFDAAPYLTTLGVYLLLFSLFVMPSENKDK